MAPGKLATTVAKEYDLGSPTECRHLFTSVNETHALEIGGQRYALRLSRPHKWWMRGVADRRFELELLDHLYAAGVPVPAPIARSNGDPLGQLDDGRYFTLFSWAPGQPGDNTPSRVRLVGEVLAGIHLAADRFASPHHRYSLDERNLLDRYLAFLEPTPEEAAYIDEHAAEIRRRIRAFDPGPGGWGIVHGDVQGLNLLFTDADELTFVDFDLCGYGWRTYDLATYVTRIPERLRQPFLDGYEAVRPLNESEHDMLPTIGRLAWIRENIGAASLVRRLREPYMTFA